MVFVGRVLCLILPAVAKLDQRIPELSDAEVIVGMMRIVAMAGNAHTSI